MTPPLNQHIECVFLVFLPAIVLCRTSQKYTSERCPMLLVVFSYKHDLALLSKKIPSPLLPGPRLSPKLLGFVPLPFPQYPAALVKLFWCSLVLFYGEIVFFSCRSRSPSFPPGGCFILLFSSKTTIPPQSSPNEILFRRDCRFPPPFECRASPLPLLPSSYQKFGGLDPIC